MTAAIETRWLGSGVDFHEALAVQRDLVAQRLAGAVPDTLLLLEHAPVYTIGRTRDRSSLHDPALLPHPVVEINRGGQATYHGPGQLVGYPIVDLRNHGRDLHLYLRLLEGVLIDTLADHGVTAGRRDGLTGVWVADRKIASLGIGVQKWITMHGFALNVTAESLPPFLAITPCGIANVAMTCLEAEARQRHGVRDVAKALAARLGAALAP
ncbi:MAG: lipoyl(octanoyl) transferase LipB [Akkermansiaceae bacterium]|nr:lipoyl(octanoyl) transferase LipB [Akkermansiaceae bacterium]